ncbi:MAG: hypothetical protein QM831_27205 [Kofleriaceae bacterium]
MRFLLVLALCGTSFSTPRVTDDHEWRAMEPTWGQWKKQRKLIPHDRERAMAKVLLRGGNFSCPAAKKLPAHCTDPIPLKEPARSAGFDDPCFRHVLATWAIRMLSEDEIDAMRDDLLPLAQLPLEEWPLVAEIVRRIALVDPEHAVPMLEAIGRRKLRERLSFQYEVGKVSPSSQQRLRTAHMYKDILEYNPDKETDWLLEQAADQGYDDDERVWAIRRAFEATDKTKAKAAYVKLAGDPNCKVAVAAAIHLAMLGERSMMPVKNSSDPKRAICMITQDVSYYTVGTRFEKEVEALRESYHVKQSDPDRYCGMPDG